MTQSWDTGQMTSDSETGLRGIGVVWAREPTDGPRCSAQKTGHCSWANHCTPGRPGEQRSLWATGRSGSSVGGCVDTPAADKWVCAHGWMAQTSLRGNAVLSESLDLGPSLCRLRLFREDLARLLVGMALLPPGCLQRTGATAARGPAEGCVQLCFPRKAPQP